MEAETRKVRVMGDYTKLKLIKGLAKNYLFAPTPLVLCHQITLRCNLRCSFCPFWRRAQDREELSGEEIKSAISQAAELGAVIYNVWGGEPLLRSDIKECLAHAKKEGLATYIITNGILKEKIGEIAPYLDYLSVSIDGGRETYEKLRGGDFFERAVKGIEVSKKHGIKTAINCVVCEKNLDEVEKLVALAESLNVGISFEPVHEYKDIPKETWDEVGIRSREKYEKAIEGLITLKEESRRIINSFTYLKMIKNLKPNFKCSVHKIMLHLDAYGSVTTCFNSLGRIEGKSLKELWFSEKAQEAREKMKSCTSCLFSGYVESSLLYSLSPEVIKNTISVL